MKTESQCYRDAADLLRRDGWCKGNFRCGRLHCMLGALRYVSRRRRIVDYWPRLIDVTGIPSVFNDHPDTTKNDAIAALEIAADLAS